MFKKNFFVTLLGFSLLTTSFTAFAQKTGAQEKPVQVADVETLMDNISDYQGKKVTVTGEVEDVIDKKSIIVESGGIINDEIVVIGRDSLNPKALKEDAKVQVTGTVRAVPVVEVEREVGWDLEPEVEAELKAVNVFLVADEIKPI
ncbi:MAG: hypothetical protein ACLGHN_08885 [Bacteriovoracia bacterium]